MGLRSQPGTAGGTAHVGRCRPRSALPARLSFRLKRNRRFICSHRRARPPVEISPRLSVVPGNHELRPRRSRRGQDCGRSGSFKQAEVEQAGDDSEEQQQAPYVRVRWLSAGEGGARGVPVGDGETLLDHVGDHRVHSLGWRVINSYGGVYVPQPADPIHDQYYQREYEEKENGDLVHGIQPSARLAPALREEGSKARPRAL
jgi:hypothetical protein